MLTRNRTNFMGIGAMPRRGLRNCMGVNAVRYGRGLGLGLACRRGFGCGFGRGFAFNQTSVNTQKELLSEQKAMLQDQLGAIDKQLENL